MSGIHPSPIAPVVGIGVPKSKDLKAGSERTGTIGLVSAPPSCSGIVAQVTNTALGGAGVTNSWTVPAGGPYKIRITAKGGDGGHGGSINGGGGATIIGDFAVNSGEVLEIIAGSSGVSGGSGGGGGGSGARLLVNSSYQNLLIAGGGGGAGYKGGFAYAGSGGQAGSNGANGENSGDCSCGGGSGGATGNGGQPGSTPFWGGSGGGGGVNSAGGNGTGVTGGGSGFGATGGSGQVSGGGGFGGGGGAGSSSGAGGGGYSGGGGGAGANVMVGSGGGGGSLNTGTNQSNTPGGASPGTASNGYVTVECLGAISLSLVTSVSPNPVCAGSTAALFVTASDGTSPYSYTWAAPAGITLSATSTSAVSASVGAGVSGVQTFTVTVMATGGAPTSTSLVSLTVNAATFTTSNPAICQGQYVNLGNFTGNKSPINGDLTYYTSLTNAQAATNALVSGLVGPVNNPTTYYARYDAAGCFSIQPITVTFKPASPTPPALTQSGHTYTGGVASVTIAQNSESVSLAVPGCDGTVSWSGPNNFISFSSTISVPTSTTGSFTYSASCSSQTACFSGSSQATVTVLTQIPTPTITLGTPGAICSDAVTVLIPYTATTGNPTAYTVSGTGIAGNGSLSGSSGNLTASLTSGFTGSFSVVVQTSQGQSSSLVSGSVLVNAAPTASIVANPSLSVCQGASVTLTASGGDPGASYLWNNGQTTSFISINTNDPSGNPGEGGGYSGPAGPQSVTVTNAAGCSATATISLTINPVPTASITPSNLTVCAGTPASLTASGGSIYQWSNGETTAVISVTSAGTYSVTVSGTSGPVGETGISGGRVAAVVGCYASASATVTVNPAPSVSINPSSTTLTNASPTVSLTAVGTGTYKWSTGATTQVIAVNTSGTYSVTLTNAIGCTASASVGVSGADLTVTLDLPQANFAGTGSVGNLVVNVFEVGGLPTSSGNVTITVTAPIGYTLSFAGSVTSINVSGGDHNPVSVDNPQWTVTQSLAGRQLTLIMNAGGFISGGGESSLGFSLTRTSANSGSTANITVNVKDDLTMSYDGNLSNNVYARIISGYNGMGLG